MTFSKQQKLKITEEPIKNACCRRALIQGILAACGERLEGGAAVVLDRDYVSFVHDLFAEQYGKDLIQITRPQGGRGAQLYARSVAADKYLTEIENGISFQEKCPMCQAAFLRGVFLSSGSVSDPEKNYNIDFYLKSRTYSFAEFFSGLGLHFRVGTASDPCRLYTKSSWLIEDFFALAQMNATAFLVMNAKIKNEFRNNANRIKNCEMNNISRAVLATSKQLDAIKRLYAADLLSSLPEELEATARLRLENPDMSIAQLASISVPAISKPGLSHRLVKIVKLADELLAAREVSIDPNNDEK